MFHRNLTTARATRPLLALILAVSMLPATLPAQGLPQGVQKVTSVEGITEYHLANGLRVLLFPDPTKSNITVNITYMVGSRHEDYGETGMAHLLEHLMFKGSTNHTNVPKELQDHGARPNGTTWFDRTNYFETFNATDENLQWALSLEADRMVNSFIAKKDLDSEMTVVRNEFEAGENDPDSILEERVMSTAYLWHNYGKSTIGARSDLEQVPIERLQAFWRHFYQPDNAVLVVAGKFDEAKTLELVQKYYGSIPKPTRQLRRTYTAEPTQDGERNVTLRRVGDVQAVAAVWHIPPGSNEEFAPMEMAGRILGDIPSGRLYKALVETKKAASVNTNEYQLKDPGVFIAHASVRTESSLADARKTLLDTIDEVKTKPFTKEELERVRANWLKNFDLALNNSAAIALQLSEWQGMGDWRLMFLHRDRIKKVTLEQVQKAAEKYLIASNRTVGEFIPEKAPVRAEVPSAPDVTALVKDYKGEALVSQGESFDASPENIDKRTIRGDLKGGIKLSFITKKTRGNQVVATLNLHFGDVNNLKNKDFAAGFAGQMLMRGTPKHTRQQIKDEFDRLKASVRVMGNETGANVGITTTKENLQPVLTLVAELLKESNFPQSEFDQLKQQTLAQLEQQKSEPQAIAVRAVQRHMNPYEKGDVRYVHTVDEEVESVKALTLDEVKAFHKAFYGASHGEFVVVGDFDPETTQKEVSDLFNDWKSQQAFARVKKAYIAVEPENKVFETPDKANAMFIAGLPVKINDTNPDYPAMLVGNYILGSGMNSRLFARIRGKEGLSYGVGAQFMASPEDDGGIFMAFAICAPQNASKVEASFKDEVGLILEKGYSEAEVTAAKKSLLEARQVSRANDNELVGRMAGQRFYNRTMAFDTELESRIQKLTPADIQAAMKKYLDISRMSFYKAGDFKKAAATN
ncbi:pitrilysin family protein [uncultured Paludibaculum sp.]|uniref:M16 family metallopeptidase n=1 Tax=uncultured Paludibaculum sp. TaxID=1765020 RepID=UPI002AAB0105|nr:pitrilysin family protein [uncultured Paludibaculum sp.]